MQSHYNPSPQFPSLHHTTPTKLTLYVREHFSVPVFIMWWIVWGDIDKDTVTSRPVDMHDWWRNATKDENVPSLPVKRHSRIVDEGTRRKIIWEERRYYHVKRGDDGEGWEGWRKIVDGDDRGKMVGEERLMHAKDGDGISIIFRLVFFIRYTNMKPATKFPASQWYIWREKGIGRRRITNGGERMMDMNTTRRNTGYLYSRDYWQYLQHHIPYLILQHLHTYHLMLRHLHVNRLMLYHIHMQHLMLYQLQHLMLHLMMYYL